jgi:hypothetical protein
LTGLGILGSETGLLVGVLVGIVVGDFVVFVLPGCKLGLMSGVGWFVSLVEDDCVGEGLLVVGRKKFQAGFNVGVLVIG